MVNRTGANYSLLDPIQEQVMELLMKYWGNVPEVIRQIKTRYGVPTSYGSLDRALKRWKTGINLKLPASELPPHLNPPSHPIEVLDKKEINQSDIRDHFYHLQEIQKTYWKISRMQESVHIRYRFNEPIG
ncbi:MAG: hypothetical protein ACXADF_14475, partial [Candidatus Thorarchaeota archaeon]